MDCHRCRRNLSDSEEMGFHFHPSVFQISTDESPYSFEVTPSRWHIKDSLLRIMASAATVPQTLRDDVVDELENQL